MLCEHLLEVGFTFFSTFTHKTITKKKYVPKGLTFWICICCFLLLSWINFFFTFSLGFM